MADISPKTNTPSRISERFFKQISFHAKFTFNTKLVVLNQFCRSKFITGAKKRLCNLNTVRDKAF